MKKIILISALIVCTRLVFGLGLLHVPPQAFPFAQDLQLTLEIQQDLNDIAELKLNYRKVGSSQWLSEIAKQDTPGSVYFMVTIPAKVLNTEPVEYYFSALLKHGTTENFPAQDGLTPNYTIKPETMTGDASRGFVLLSDAPSISSDEGYLLAVSYFALMGDVDPASIELWVGGKNVTSAAQNIPPTLVYRENNPQPGIKKAIVRAKLGSKMIHSETWATEILPGSKKAAKPFDYHGTINFASNYYNYSDPTVTPGAGDNDAAAWTDLYAKYGIVDAHANVYVSSLEKTNRQPVNRYTLGLKIPHLDIYAGDYAPDISQLTLYGRNLRGLYGKLHSRYVALFLAHGQSVRKTISDTDIDPSITGIQKAGTFKQEGFGARLQFGGDNDFRMGFNLTRHRDVVSSLDSTYYQYTRTDISGNQETIYTKPATDNAVLSYDIHVNLPEQKTIFGAEIAGSILNNNTIPGPITLAEMEEYSGQNIIFDPSDYSNIFVFNKNMEPFVPSRANLAWLAYLRTYFWNNLISVQYSETGSAFNAYGAQYQQSDSKAVNIHDQFNLSRFLVLTGGYNFTEDNLLRHKSEFNATNSWYAQGILRLARLPYLKAAYYSNTSKNRDNGDVAVHNPFTKIVRQSNNLVVGLGYNLSQIPFVPTQLDVSYRMGADNADKSDSLSTTILSDNESDGLNITMYNRFKTIPLTTQFAMGLNNHNNLLDTEDNQNQNLFFGAGYSFWNKRIMPYANYRLVTLSGAQDKQAYSYVTLGVEAYPIKDLLINTSLGMQNHSNDIDSTKDYDSLTWRVLLTQRF